MEQDYLVFWRKVEYLRNGCAALRPIIVRVKYPPHEQPRGSVLEELLRDGLGANSADAIDIVAVELPPVAWSHGKTRELSLGGGQIACIECTAAGWRVHA